MDGYCGIIKHQIKLERDDMIDFHAHFLPGIDDGARSVSEAIGILQESRQQGIDVVFATPHFYATEDLPKHFLRERNAAYERLLSSPEYDEGAMPKILLGAEVYYFPGMSYCEELRELKMGGLNMLLVEPPMEDWTEDVLDELENIGSLLHMVPVMAHLDRYMRYMNNYTLPEKLAGRRLLVQMNASAFLRESFAETALELLKDGRVDLLGTDAHNLTDRRPNMGEAAQKIREAGCAAQLAGINERGYRLVSVER